MDIQKVIFNAVKDRGYLRGEVLMEQQKQVLKALEELGEVAACVFDGRAIPVNEIADVLIPLFLLAELQHEDLLEAALLKANSDIKRGVRGGN